MSTKPFFVMVIAVLVLGASLGGAFVGGIALGNSQDDPELPGAARPQSLTDSLQAQSAGDVGALGQNELAQIRQRIQSGEATPEELAQLRQRFQDGADGLAGCG